MNYGGSVRFCRPNVKSATKIDGIIWTWRRLLQELCRNVWEANSDAISFFTMNTRLTQSSTCAYDLIWNPSKNSTDESHVKLFSTWGQKSRDYGPLVLPVLTCIGDLNVTNNPIIGRMALLHTDRYGQSGVKPITTQPDGSLTSQSSARWSSRSYCIPARPGLWPAS